MRYFVEQFDEPSSSGSSAHLRKMLAEVKNMSEFARITGLNRRSLDRYRDGMEPSLSVAAIIAKALNVPLDALVYGVSDQMKGELVSESVALIPFLNVQGSAGPGMANNNPEVLDSIPFARSTLRRLGVKPENAHAITSRGDSMLPTIADGQILLIDAAIRRVRQDAIYALSIDGDVRIKRIQKGVDGSLTLKSDNPNYEPEVLSAHDAEKLTVEGRVFWTERVL
jgi:phage repressor protein C with HTH and peptisase S24 domain